MRELISVSGGRVGGWCTSESAGPRNGVLLADLWTATDGVKSVGSRVVTQDLKLQASLQVQHLLTVTGDIPRC